MPQEPEKHQIQITHEDMLNADGDLAQATANKISKYALDRGMKPEYVNTHVNVNGDIIMEFTLIPLTPSMIAEVLHGPDIPEPKPKPSIHPAVWDLVIEDMKARDEMGFKKYGTRLRPFNGRDPLWDRYQEQLDALAYTRQEIYERDNPDAKSDLPA